MQHINSLDGYRFLAALIVLFGHFSNQSGIFAKTFGGGAEQIGVVMFFCLSGYLMGAIYLSSKFSAIAVSIYFSRRLGRVIPLFLFFLATGALLNATGKDATFYKIDHLTALRGIALLEGVNVMWSIVTECRFYFVFPLVWLAFSRSRTLGIFSLLLALLLGWSFKDNEHALPKEALIQYLHIFSAGAGLSLLHTSGKHRAFHRFFSSNPRTLNLLWICAGLSIVAIYPGVSERLFNSDRGQSAYSDPYALSACCLFLILSIYSPLAQKILGCRFATFGGRISFSIYLWHMPVIWTSEAIFSDAPLGAQLMAVVFLTLSISWLSYRFIEIPGQFLFRKITQPGAGLSPQAPLGGR